MSWNLAMVKARVRSLVDDPAGSWAKDDFIVPLIDEVYADANAQLVATQTSWDLSVVECPGIQPGTPNLAGLQATGELLGTLTDQPLRIDWKPAGNPPNDYLLVRNYEVLPDIIPAQYMVGWEYRSEVIWLTPCTIAVDLRVRGEFGPPPLNTDDSVLISHPRMGLAVSYGTAALLAVVRGNKSWETTYGQKAMEIMDDICGELVRNEQGVIRRLGRVTRRGGRGFNYVATQ